MLRYRWKELLLEDKTANSTPCQFSSCFFQSTLSRDNICFSVERMPRIPQSPNFASKRSPGVCVGGEGHAKKLFKTAEHEKIKTVPFPAGNHRSRISRNIILRAGLCNRRIPGRLLADQGIVLPELACHVFERPSVE